MICISDASDYECTNNKAPRIDSGIVFNSIISIYHCNTNKKTTLKLVSGACTGAAWTSSSILLPCNWWRSGILALKFIDFNWICVTNLLKFAMTIAERRVESQRILRCDSPGCRKQALLGRLKIRHFSSKIERKSSDQDIFYTRHISQKQLEISEPIGKVE